ncbi:hypothetical protein MPDQ_003473 [Monascus purpureus]|uniref:Uncharacterized protein n=1 Tax=Monascus purpureus TaxID=5098 RepID=A0A507QYW2_MONPU|nr:hypothetical protein MPDQ_003473 [Monascus purpureus]
MDRSTLEEYRITYVEEILPFQNETADGKEAPVKLPAHVESLREALLYFGPLLPENRKAFFEKEGKQSHIWTPIRSKRDENRLPQGFRDFELTLNFSVDVLGSLRSTGLVSSPLPGIHEWIKDDNYRLIRSHLLCFSFAVVQLKPVEEQQDADEVYICEAANAASAALTLLDSLYE